MALKPVKPRIATAAVAPPSELLPPPVPPPQSVQAFTPKVATPTYTANTMQDRGPTMPQLQAVPPPRPTTPIPAAPASPLGPWTTKPAAVPGKTPAVAPSGPRTQTGAAPPQTGGPLQAPPEGGFTPEWMIQQYNDAYGKATAANEQRYGDILGQYGSLIGQTNQGIQQFGNDLMQQAQTAGGQLLGGYDDRYKRNMDYLANAGQQEGSDIRAQYAAQGNNMEQGLRDRGMAGTTVQNSLRAGNTREQTNALGRLNERVNQQRVQADTQLSGDKLNAQSGLDQSMQSLANQLGQYAINTNQNLTQDKLGFMERREDAYPELGQYASLLQNYAANGGKTASTEKAAADKAAADKAAELKRSKDKKETGRDFLGITSGTGSKMQSAYRVHYADGTTKVIYT